MPTDPTGAILVAGILFLLACWVNHLSTNSAYREYKRERRKRVQLNMLEKLKRDKR